MKYYNILFQCCSREVGYRSNGNKMGQITSLLVSCSHQSVNVAHTANDDKMSHSKYV